MLVLSQSVPVFSGLPSPALSPSTRVLQLLLRLSVLVAAPGIATEPSESVAIVVLSAFRFDHRFVDDFRTIILTGHTRIEYSMPHSRFSTMYFVSGPR